ncbi:MMPL family transporter [Conexibacter sp. DBS9H8]|uniref:MMPL family transporter n=1 Tax=Conexibacter sp. DBS9H8 TaxID=2937801 RepID=UPI002010B7A2|nr:MMPL family transporter [Conexibacter sp. DBS9H8]
MVAATRWVLAHRRCVVGVWVLLTLAGAATVNAATRSFSTAFTVPGSEGYTTNVQIVRTFHSGGNNAPLLAVIHLPPGATATRPLVQDGLKAVAARLRTALPGARIASYASTHSPAFVSRDGQTTFLIADPLPDPHASFGVNTAAAKAATAALAHTTVLGAPVQVTGVDALQNATGGGGGPGVLVESVLGGVGALAVLAVVFASLLAIVPILMAIVAIMTTFLVLYGVAQLLSVSFIVEFLVGLIGLGVAIDYSLLVIVRWREQRARGAVGEAAVIEAMSTAGRAVAFSGSTVAIGLLALIVLPLPFLRSIGLAGMLIPLVSVLVAITLLPVLLLGVGERLDWPHRRSEVTAGRRWTAWARATVRLRWPAAIGALALLIALVIAATSLNPGTSNVNTLARSGEAHAGLETLNAAGIGAGALQPIEILSDGGQAGARRVAAAVAHLPGVHGAVAPGGPAWEHGRLALADAFTVADPATAAGAAALNRVIAAARRFGPGVRVGGTAAESADFVHVIYSHFPEMVALIAVLTFLLLARAFRSLILPLKAVLLNVISVGAAWGVMTLVWQDGHGSRLLYGIAPTHAITSWIPLMVFAFLFGLSMDYEVFILSRVREEYDASGSTDEAVTTGLGRTGRLVTSAALILFLAFIALSSGPETDIKVFATGLAAGILLDATVIRALLVPALVSLLGRWNWWLPEWSARLLRISAPPPRDDPVGA